MTACPYSSSFFIYAHQRHFHKICNVPFPFYIFSSYEVQCKGAYASLWNNQVWITQCFLGLWSCLLVSRDNFFKPFFLVRHLVLLSGFLDGEGEDKAYCVNRLACQVLSRAWLENILAWAQDFGLWLAGPETELLAVYDDNISY